VARRGAAIAATEGAEVVVICNKIEAEISELADEERAEFLQALGIEEPGLQSRDPRRLQTAWPAPLLHLRPQGSAGPGRSDRHQGAPGGRGHPHGFREGFHPRRGHRLTTDYVACGGEAGRKDAGKWRLEGKEYEVRDGDVVLFRFKRLDRSEAQVECAYLLDEHFDTYC